MNATHYERCSGQTRWITPYNFMQQASALHLLKKHSCSGWVLPSPSRIFSTSKIYNDPCRYILPQNLTNSSPNFRKFLPHLWILLLCGHVLFSGITLLLLLNWTPYTLILLHWLHNRIILSICYPDQLIFTPRAQKSLAQENSSGLRI